MDSIDSCVVDQRMRFVTACLKGGESVSAISRENGISRKTTYKWLNRYRSEGTSGLFDRSRAPNSNPQTIAENVIETVLTVRLRHPSWGPDKVKSHLECLAPDRVWPSSARTTCRGCHSGSCRRG